jgi:hypothetical protein
LRSARRALLATGLAIAAGCGSPAGHSDGGGADLVIAGRDGAPDLAPAPCAKDSDCPPAAASCCGGHCLDTGSDPMNCHGCGHVCPPWPHATAGCFGGLCGIGECAPGWGDCDQLTANGCEIDLANDPLNCGACGAGCTVPNGTAACAAQHCAVGACDTGFADCDHSVSNGCETMVSSDPANCGGCAMACAPAHATGSCAGGACSLTRCDAN